MDNSINDLERINVRLQNLVKGLSDQVLTAGGSWPSDPPMERSSKSSSEDPTKFERLESAVGSAEESASELENICSRLQELA